MRNNFEENFPELAKEWDQARNEGIILSDITTGSNKYVWWRCSKDNEHMWKTRLAHRNSGSGCPFCSGHKKLTE